MLFQCGTVIRFTGGANLPVRRNRCTVHKHYIPTMDDANKPSATPFSITDILNRKDIQGLNNNSTSLWERRGYDHHHLPSYLQTSPCLPSTFNFQAFAPCSNYPCSSQPRASSPKDKSHSEEKSEENTDAGCLSKEPSKFTHLITF